MNGFAIFLTVVFIILVFAAGGFLYSENRQLQQENAELKAALQDQEQKCSEIASNLVAAQVSNLDLQSRLATCQQQPANLQIASTAPQPVAAPQASAQSSDGLLGLAVLLALGGMGMVVTAGGAAYLKMNSR
jgi:hypothetical protein